MIRLLEIEWLKLRHYRIFWILLTLYFLVLGIVCGSGMLFLQYLESRGASFQNISPMLIPIYDFPDIWQNLTYLASFFRIILAFLVIISVTNESSYRTLRQNIIDGLNRKEFLLSKLSLVFVLSLMNTIFLLMLGMVLGLIFSSVVDARFIFSEIVFLGAHFLELFTFLLLAMLCGLLLKKAGLAIVLLVLYTMFIEPLITISLPSEYASLYDLLPVKSLNNLIDIPFPRYIFREMQNFIAWKSALIVGAYAFIYTGLSYLYLTKKDL